MQSIEDGNSRQGADVPTSNRLSNLRLKELFFLFVAGVTTACTAYQPKIVVNENGPQYPNSPGSFAIFKTHYDALYAQEISNNFTGNYNMTYGSNNLVKEGTSLAYQLCSSFFKTAGTEQQYLLFSRDVIGVVGTLATGVLGATGASSTATAWVGLGSGAALSGISIYTRNFLFSEDNVQAVQHLTLTAMNAATAKALQRTDYDFFSAVQTIMDVQSVCEVQSILSLVRQSINQVQPVAKTTDGGVSVAIPPQEAIRQSGINAVSAAAWLQVQKPADVRAAAANLDNYQAYRDAAQFPLKTSVATSAWTFDRASDPQHLADVAKKMGWTEQ